MDRFGIGQIRLPEFDLGCFRLPLFGDASGTSGNHENRLHKSLVDAWYFSGYSNDNPPTQVIGVKENALSLMNFAFNLGSGFGIYANNFTKFHSYPANGDAVVFTTSGLKITKALTYSYLNLAYANNIGFKSMKVRVSGLPSDLTNSLRWEYAGSDGKRKIMNIPSDGIYTLPESILDSEGGNFLIGFYILEGNLLAERIVGLTIEQIPENEGYLCFDGVDDHAICNNLPLLEDYTVICRRKYIGTAPGNGIKVLASKLGTSSPGEFILEYRGGSGTLADQTLSYGFSNNIDIEQSPVFYQTKSSYNGDPIQYDYAPPTDVLYMGCDKNKSYCDCAIAYFSLYNRTLTTEEIEEEKVKLEAEWNKRLIK